MFYIFFGRWQNEDSPFRKCYKFLWYINANENFFHDLSYDEFEDRRLAFATTPQKLLYDFFFIVLLNFEYEAKTSITRKYLRRVSLTFRVQYNGEERSYMTISEVIIKEKPQFSNSW